MIQASQRQTSLPYVPQDSFHLGEKSQPPYKPYRQYQYRQNADRRDIEVDRGKQVKEECPVGTRNPEESGERARLQQQCHQGNQHHAHRINEPFGNDGSQRFRKRNPIVFGQNAAAGNLAHTREHQIGGIRDKDGIDAVRGLRMLIQRSQSQQPAPPSEQV